MVAQWQTISQASPFSALDDGRYRGRVTEDICTTAAVFYASNDLTTAQDLKILQCVFDLLIGLFDQFNFRTNTIKTTSVRMPTGQGWTDSRRVECHVCRKYFVAGVPVSNLVTKHGIYHTHLMVGERRGLFAPWRPQSLRFGRPLTNQPLDSGYFDGCCTI